MSEELKNTTLIANDMTCKIVRLREELKQVQAASAVTRAQMLEDIAVGLVSGQLGVVWDEELCAKVMKQGPLAFAAYAQVHIAETLRDKAKADTS